MSVFIGIMADAVAGLLLLTAIVLGGLFLSVVVMLLLPTSAGKKDIGGILLRLFSVAALLKLAGITAFRAVFVTIVVMALYLVAFGWAGKRTLEILVPEQQPAIVAPAVGSN